MIGLCIRILSEGNFSHELDEVYELTRSRRLQKIRLIRTIRLIRGLF